MKKAVQLRSVSMWYRIPAFLLVSAMLLSFSTGLAPARALGFVVTSFADSGPGTLRQAIIDANAAAGEDTITFAAPGTITLDWCLPAVTDTLTIDGGANTVTVSGNNGGFAAFISFGRLTLRNLTVTHSVNGLRLGAASSTDINGCTFSGNLAGIVDTSVGGTLTVSDCTFKGNEDSGIWREMGCGPMTVTNCVFNNNTCIMGKGAFL